MIQDLFFCRLSKLLFCKVVTDMKGRLFSGHDRFKFTDHLGHTGDPHLGLNPVCQIICNRDLDNRLRVESSLPGGLRNLHRLCKTCIQPVIIFLHPG